MTLQMLYILPMILGRTYDAATDSIGVDIFSKDAISNPRIKAETSYDSAYRQVDTSAKVKDILGIKGALALKIKGGTFGLKGAGSYLQESLHTENSVDILVRVTYRTNSISLSPSIKPKPDWFLIDSRYLGTHFVQTIIYGGDLYARVRFKALKAEYLQDIKGAVTVSLEAGSALKLVAEGELEKLQKKLEGKSSLEVSYYATVPVEGVPNTIDGLRKLVTTFEDQVKKVNDGWGVPAEVQLAELSMFDNRFQYLKNTNLETVLGQFEELLDDLLETKSRMKSWVATLPSDLPEDKEKMIDDLRIRISNTLKTFYETISQLDLTKGVEQLIKSRLEYKKNSGSSLPGKFKRRLDKLQNLVESESEKPPHRGYTTFTLYGRKSCLLVSNTSLVHSGYLATSPEESTGSAVDYVCMPEDPMYFLSLVFNEKNLKERGSTVQGVKFGLLDNNHPLKSDSELVLKGVLCSVCMVEGRTTVTTFYDTDTCVDESWTKQYSGYLMSSDSESKAQAVCVDDSPDFNTENYMDRRDQSLVFIEIPSENSKTGYRPMQCVVCSK